MKHIRNYLATGRTIPEGWHIHHIVPKCEGGTDDASNLIALHPTMHEWTHEMRGDKKAASGVYNMRNGLSKEARIKISLAKKGKPLSDKHKLALRGTRPSVTGENHYSFGKTLPKVACENCGKLLARHVHSRWHGDNCKQQEI